MNMTDPFELADIRIKQKLEDRPEEEQDLLLDEWEKSLKEMAEEAMKQMEEELPDNVYGVAV